MILHNDILTSLILCIVQIYVSNLQMTKTLLKYATKADKLISFVQPVSVLMLNIRFFKAKVVKIMVCIMQNRESHWYNIYSSGLWKGVLKKHKGREAKYLYSEQNNDGLFGP